MESLSAQRGTAREVGEGEVQRGVQPCPLFHPAPVLEKEPECEIVTYRAAINSRIA